MTDDTQTIENIAETNETSSNERTVEVKQAFAKSNKNR